MMTHKCYITVLFIYILILTCKAMKCTYEDGKEVGCPGPNDPSDFSRCCWNSSVVLCCPLHASDVNLERSVMVVGITVISACMFFSVLIVVCCFWSRCPLFKMCRVNYTHSEILSYSKEEEALGMPHESSDGRNHYSPCHVTIKPVQDL